MARIDRLEVKLPEVPSLVFELNETIADSMSSAADIAQIINKGPSLAATLLKIWHPHCRWLILSSMGWTLVIAPNLLSLPLTTKPGTGSTFR